MTQTYEVIRTTASLVALRNEWSELLKRSGLGSPFLTWEWMCTWWESYCGDTDSQRRLAVVVARQGPEITGILPGYCREALGLTYFEFLGTEHESTDYTAVIESAAAGRSSLPEMLEAVLRAEPRLDIIHLSNILESDPIVVSLQRYASSRGTSYESQVFRVCPMVPIAGSWEGFVEGLGAKMRKNVRRGMRQLSDAGGVFELVNERAAVRPAVRELFALHAGRFEKKNDTTGFRAELREPFHATVAERFFDGGILRMFRLTIGGRLVATLYCFEYGGALFYFQGGMDPEFDRLSVGTLLVAHAIKYAFDKQLAFFDFMRGDEPYKFRWTQHTRRIVAIRLGVSRRGRAALFARGRFLDAKRLVKRFVRPTTAAEAAQSAAAP